MMEFIGLVINSLKTIVGAIYPPLKKKYFDQPKLYLQFERENSWMRSRGLSPMNDPSKPFDIMRAIYHYDLIWRYKLIIRNNSEYAAYNIILLRPQQDDSFNLNPSIELLQPISPSHEKEYRVNFSVFHAGTGSESNDIIGRDPDLLTKQKYILQYTNVKGTKFFTVFDRTQEEQDRNDFLKKVKKNNAIKFFNIGNVMLVFHPKLKKP